MRHWVVAGLFVLSLITYIDRAAISSAKDAMSADLGLTNQQMGAVFSAFALGYALAQIPSAREQHLQKEEHSFSQIFRHGRMLLLLAQYFAVNFTTFLCLTWMLPYLKQRYSLSAEDAALYSMIPLLWSGW